MTIGLSWESGSTDLDSAVLIGDANSEIVDRVYWNNLISADASIESLGDARSGDAEGDDETIEVSLYRVDESYKTLYIIISIYDSDNLVFF